MSFVKLYLSQNRLISGDGRYYYAQIRSPIYDGDLDFYNDLVLYNPNQADITKERIHPETGKIIIKYPIGNALLFSPAVISAKLLVHLLNTFGASIKQDGYAPLNQFFIGLFSSFYLLLAMMFIYRLIFLFTPFQKLAALLVLIGILASPAVYYATMEASMSHISSLLGVSAYLYFSLSAYGRRKNCIQQIAIVSSAALMILSRNQNLGFLVISIFEVFHFLKKGNYAPLKNYLSMTLGGLLLLIPQFLYWQILYGQPIVYSYGGESFSNWYFPKIFSVLFSRISGLFFWHPYLLLGLGGIFMMIRDKKPFSEMLLLVFLIQVYINASWGCWWLGDAFGYRGLINTLPVLITGIAYLFHRIKDASQAFILISVGIFFIVLNHLLIFEYSAGWIEHHGPLYYTELFRNIMSI